jgi:isoquinoline 1-oxidoreductase beta subunit
MPYRKQDLSSPGRTSELTRRQFLKLTTLAGPGLTLGYLLPGCGDGAGWDPAAALAMPFLHIAPDNTVTVISKHLEAGQGVWTGLAAIVAEELDASWEQMRVESAPAKVPTYGNLAFDPRGLLQGTGFSTSISNSWNQLRQAGATARAMLVAAAARHWGVAAEEINISAGVVSHADSGKRAAFGELAPRAARLPVPSYARVKSPGQYRIIGRERLPRLDSRAKSTGAQIYAIDVMFPGMMTAMVVRPPRFGAKVAAVDSSDSLLVPGVIDVVQIPQGVAVVGRDTHAAKKGREALRVAWDESRAEKRSSAELLQQYKWLARQGDAAIAARAGDADLALQHAARVIDAEFEFPYLAHAPMEPLSAVCRLGPGNCEIWAGSQLQTIDQKNAARAVGLRPEQVVIHTLAAGGSFGRRADADSDYIAEVAAIAKATEGRYPVRLIWTREDDVSGGRYRPLNYHHITAGLDQTGKLVALKQRVVGQSVMAGTPFAYQIKDGLDPAAVEGHAAEQYEIPNVHVTWTQPQVGVPVLWWQSVGHSHMAFSKEVIIDELAQAAGQDPVDFRLKLLARRPRHAAVLKLAAQKAGWEVPFPRLRGRGRGVAVHASFGSIVAQIAEVTVEGGRVIVDRVVCAVDCGVAVTPDVIRAQMESSIGYGLAAALHGKITVTEGRVDQTNFHQYPVLRMSEMPRLIEVHIVPSTAAPSGVGEIATPPIAPAIANAVRAATGIRLRKMPFELAMAAAPPAPPVPSKPPAPRRPVKPGGARRA